MKQIPIIVFIHTVAFLGIASILHILQANSSLSGWIFPALEAGLITCFGGAIVHLFPRFLPKRFFAVTHSTKESFETHSWFGSVNAVLAFGILIVSYSASVLASPGTVLLSRHSGSLFMSALFPIFSLMFSANQLLQIIGDGTSGIRIYPDHIEIRKIGRYGWSFKKDDIEKVEVLDDIFPLVAVDGQGKRTDRLWSSILPDARTGKIEGSILAGISGHDIYQKLIDFGYGDQAEFNESPKPRKYSKINQI